MSKKILVITQNFYPEIGSAGNRMKNIFQLLIDQGYDVKVITTEPTYPNKNIYEDQAFWDDDSMNQHTEKIIRVKVKNRKYSRSIINRLFYYIEMAIKMIFYILFNRGNYDYVFVTSPPIFIAMVGLLASVRYRCKLILDIRDLWPESLKGVGVFNYPFIIYIFKQIELILYKKSTQIIVNSRGFILYMQNAGISLKKITYIPNAARESEVVSKDEETLGFNVVYAGNIGLAQDANVLMNLAYELNKHEINLSIISYGMKRKELVDFVNENKLSNVKIIKPKTRKECLNIISQHQVGIVTLNESEVFKTVLPGKVIDYMTCRVPIVAAVSGNTKDLIEKERVGFVSTTRDASELLEFILTLYKSPNLYNEICSNCTRFINEYFLWEKNCHDLINIIENKNFKLEKAEVF
ncbi:glycosyltransferase family 4 protein [Bacillus pinisoli]|uniref:glycosyltransferase family 4 protein n=1 Tax=Bacillus pinisoli TaxID=2901866 RepID=UPI001FF1C096|nr:glycosyltransferase family 4 protein [Bacillus pinisoli]